jgi:hypothetical protein
VIDSIPEKELKQQDEDKCKGVIFRGNGDFMCQLMAQSVKGPLCVF